MAAPSLLAPSAQEGASGAPTVSIGLPVYNGEAFLAEALDSILAQTFTDFELIICDNASDDATGAICERYAAQDPRIRYHRHPRNRGAQINYDTSFAMARGRYFKWAAHDDVLAPQFLEECVRALDSDPRCALAFGQTVAITSTGEAQWCFVAPRALASEDPIERLATRFGGNFNFIFGLMRREVMATTGLHGDFPYSDTVFLAEMALRGGVRVVDKALFYNRMHEATSLKANTDPRDIAMWFSGKRPKLTFPRTRQYWGLAQAVLRAPLSPWDTMRGLSVVLESAYMGRRRLVKEWLLPFYINGQPTRLTRSLRLVRGLFRADSPAPAQPARRATR